MSASTIFTAFRALLTGLSLVDDPDGTTLENEALSRFTSEAQLDFLEARPGAFAGGRLQNVNQSMIAMRGIRVTTDRDTANKAYLVAANNIISEFLTPANRPTGCRKVYFRRYWREEKSDDTWLVFVEFEIEYTLTA